MKYMGSKNRIAKHILPIMLKERTSNRQAWVEPMCGGCNLIDKVPGVRLASDSNPYLIAMLKKLQLLYEIGGIDYVVSHVPISIDKKIYSTTRAEYNKGNKTSYPLWLIGWIGYMASFNGRFFDGGYSGISKHGRNMVQETINNFLKQLPNVIGIRFGCCDYNELVIPHNSLIYIDPPYLDTKKYNRTYLDHEKLFDFCKEMKLKGHTVFISEKQDVKDFSLVWEGKINNGLKSGNQMTEKLYKV